MIFTKKLMKYAFLSVAMSGAGCSNQERIMPKLSEHNLNDYVQVDPDLNEQDRSRLNQAINAMAASSMGLELIIKAGKDRKLTLTIDNDIEISALDFENNILSFGRGVHQMGHYCEDDESFARVKIRDFLYHEMYHIVYHGPLEFDPSLLWERENETVKATDDYRLAVTGTCPRTTYTNNSYLEPSQFFPANLQAMTL